MKNMKETDLKITTPQEQENNVLEIHALDLKPEFKIVDKIDLDSLNQSTRPRKKTKEEKRKEREERENLRMQQRQEMKDAILKEIHNKVYGLNSRKMQKEETENDSINQERLQKMKGSDIQEIFGKSAEMKSIIHENTRLNSLTRKLNVGIRHIISYLEKHPELGNVPKSTPNSLLNEKQTMAVIEYFKNAEKNININLASLLFEQGYATIKYNNDLYILKEKRFNPELNKIKKDNSLFSNNTIELILENKNKLFVFKNKDIHDKLIMLAKELSDKKLKERELKKERKLKEQQQKNNFVVVTTDLLSLSFYNNNVIYKHNDIKFTHHDDSFLKEYNTLKIIAKNNFQCKKSLQMKLRLTLNITDKTFTWNNPIFNIHNYLDVCWQKYGTEDYNGNSFIDSEGFKYESEQKKQLYCKIENIEFFDNYYKIWIINNGQKVDSIHPLIITDSNSQECLQIVSKYFENRIPNDVMIVYTNKKVEKLINGFKLQNYVETLKKNKDIPSDWWNRLDNREFKTLENYRKIPKSIVNKEVSYKNVYIDYLASYQGENPLLIAYEIFNGQEEKCFVFNISIDDKKSAIIYENININRATNVFIIEKQNYEESMNLIFNYYTDEELSRKRMSIRTNINPPEKFKAIDIRTINHDNLNTWIIKLNELIIPSLQQNNNKTAEHIHFVSGLNTRSENTERVNTKETIIVKNLHDEIKEKLYYQLSQKYGADNVGTEVSIGSKKIDLVVRNKGSYSLYEIKTYQEVRICIREAIGQIIDYAFFECKDKVDKMTIVGPNQISEEASEYLENIRLKHNLPIYYESVN